MLPADLLLLDEAGVGVMQRLQPAFSILQLPLQSSASPGVFHTDLPACESCCWVPRADSSSCNMAHDVPHCPLKRGRASGLRHFGNAAQLRLLIHVRILAADSIHVHQYTAASHW